MAWGRETRGIFQRKQEKPQIKKHKPIDSEGNDGDFSIRQIDEGVFLYFKALGRWYKTLNASSQIVPETPNASSLGTPDKPMRKMFVSSKSLHIGDTKREQAKIGLSSDSTELDFTDRDGKLRKLIGRESGTSDDGAGSNNNFVTKIGKDGIADSFGYLGLGTGDNHIGGFITGATNLANTTNTNYLGLKVPTANPSNAKIISLNASIVPNFSASASKVAIGCFNTTGSSSIGGFIEIDECDLDPPSAPPAGSITLYAKSDGLYMYQDSTVTNISTSGLPLTGGTMSGNVDFGDNDITNVDSLDADKFSIAGGTEMTAINDEDDMSSNSNTALATQQSIKAYADTKMALSGGTVTGDINLNNDVKVIYGDAGEHILGDGSDLQLTSSGSVTVTSGIFEVVSTGTGTPTLKIKNTSNQFGSGAQLHFDINPDDNVGADGDDIGLILFKTDDDGGNVTSYASIKGEISDASNGTEDGKLSLNIAVAGTLTAGIEIKESSSSPIPDITINGSSVFNSTVDINNQRIVDAQRIGFNGGGFITKLIDNDDMSSATSSSVSSSESIKAYVDSTDRFFLTSAFYAGTSLLRFIPIAGGSTSEQSSISVFGNDDTTFIVPYDLKINTIYVCATRPSSAATIAGNTSITLFKNGSSYSSSVTQNMSTIGFDSTDYNTIYTFDFSGETNTYSAAEIMQIAIDPTSTLYYVSVTIVGKYT